MRRAGPLVAAAVVVGLLAGCGGDGNGAIEDGPPPEAQEVGEAAAVTTGPADITAGKEWGPRVTHDVRGTLVKRLGQWAGLSAEDDTMLAVFRVTRIDPDLRCTGEDAQDPVNGHFVALELEVETSPQLGQTGSMATFNLHAEQFTAVLDDGQTQGRLLGEARSCLPREDYLPAAVPAGHSATGVVVLDVPEGTEAVVLDGLARSVGGWEWALP